MMAMFSFGWTIRLMIFGQWWVQVSSPLYFVRDQNIQCFRPYLEYLMILSAQSRDDNSEELLPGSLHISGERGTHICCNHDCQTIAQQLKQKKQKSELPATHLLRDNVLNNVYKIYMLLWLHTLKLSGSTCSFSECSTLRSVYAFFMSSMFFMALSSPWSTTVPCAATIGLHIMASALYRFPKPAKYRWVQGYTIKALQYTA